jgi:gas vesicle protein
MADHETIDATEPAAEPGGFLALAVIAAAAGAAAALLLAPDRRFREKRAEPKVQREQRTVAVAGFLVGAGLTALLTPESGPTTRRLLSSQLSRIKVGTIDHIERLRLAKVTSNPDTH